jgi:hypothetical protein
LGNQTVVPVDAPQGLLYEWWSVFWDVFSAGNPGKAGEPTADAQAYIEVCFIIVAVSASQTEDGCLTLFQAQVRNKLLQQQQQQHALGMGRPGQPMTAQMAHAIRQASAQSQGGFVHPNGVTGYPQGMTPQQQQYLQHQQLLAQQQQQQQQQQNASIARPASAAPQLQQPGQGHTALQQRYMSQQQSQSPASPAMTARSGVMASQLPSRQQSLPVGADGAQQNGQYYPPGTVQHMQQQQANAQQQQQQQSTQTAPSPHLGAQQMQQQKMLAARNPNGSANRATTPLQQQQMQPGQAGYPQAGPGPMQGQVPATPQTMQLQAEQRARLAAQQQQAQQQIPNAQQQQFMQQQQQQQQRHLQAQQQQQQQQQAAQQAQNQQAMQMQMDARFQMFGYGSINIPLMVQALSACNMESRSTENMSPVERVSVRVMHGKRDVLADSDFVRRIDSSIPITPFSCVMPRLRVPWPRIRVSNRAA